MTIFKYMKDWQVEKGLELVLLLKVTRTIVGKLEE